MRSTIFDQPALRLPFHLRGQEGTVSVYYGANDDPHRWGFAWLQLPFDLALVQGFPVCHARIDFPGPGYQAIMGWIQLITVQDAETEHMWVGVDHLPNHTGIDVPFTDFGYLPTLFDAPGPNPPRADETWLAETFLVYCPDIGRTRIVAEVLGFRWGYRLNQMTPTLLPVEPVPPSRWEAHRPFLSQQYPSWEFRSSPQI